MASKPQVISFNCVMKSKLGKILSSSFNQDVLNMHDIASSRLPGLVDALQSVQAGEKRSITLPANQAYGTYNPALVIELRRSEMEHPERLTLETQIIRPEGVFRIIHLDQDRVIVDGNHPLAGHDLVFEIEIISARDAKDDDLTDSSLPNRTQLIH